MSWNKLIHDFGNVNVGDSLSFTFIYSGDKQYKSHSSSCGCTTGKWKHDKLTITYKPKPLSKQVKEAGRDNYSSTKKLFINFKDGTEQILIIKARVYDI